MLIGPSCGRLPMDRLLCSSVHSCNYIPNLSGQKKQLAAIFEACPFSPSYFY